MYSKKKSFGFFLPPNPKPGLAEGIICWACHFNFDHMIGRLNANPALEGCWIFFLKKMESRFISNSSYPRSGVIFLCFPKYQVFSWVFFSIQKNHGVIIRKFFTSVPRGQSGNTKSHDGVDDEDQSLVSVWSKGYPLPEN